LQPADHRRHVSFHLQQILVAGGGDGVVAFQDFGDFGLEISEVFPYFLDGGFDGDDSVLAMQRRRVHAAGAEDFPADGAVDGEDNIVKHAPL